MEAHGLLTSARREKRLLSENDALEDCVQGQEGGLDPGRPVELYHLCEMTENGYIYAHAQHTGAIFPGWASA